MRRETNLPELQRRSLRRMAYLRSITLAAPRLTWADRDRHTAYVAIEALNLWQQYCRFFFLSCALGANDGVGRPVLNSIGTFPTEDEALRWAKKQVPDKSTDLFMREPRWSVPRIWDSVIGAMGSTVSANVTAVTGLNTNVFDQLPTFRNFFAHRSRATALPVRDFARSQVLGSHLQPTDLLLSKPASTRVSILVDWLDDLDAALGLTV